MKKHIKYIRKDYALANVQWALENHSPVDEAIERTVTEDVAMVVRCKECAYWNRSSEIMPDGEKSDYGWCGKLLDSDSETEVVTSEKDFCSFGERQC